MPVPEAPALASLAGPRVGSPAPEIVGPDLDGVEFRLSDYRGKVVVLDFWGHWWPPCRALYAHERSLVEKYQDRPFVLLGVNSDQERELVHEAVVKHRLNWRSWWAGGADGAIPRQWQVTSWPTIFVIDAQGVIRRRLTSAENLERNIDDLVNETEQGRKS